MRGSDKWADNESVIVDGVEYRNRKTIWQIESQRRSRKKRRQYLNSLKDAPCVDCDVKYPYYVMDFDHVRGVKTKPISQLPMNKMDEEVAKCDLVCQIVFLFLYSTPSTITLSLSAHLSEPRITYPFYSKKN